MQGTDAVLMLVLASLRSNTGKCVAMFASAEPAGGSAEQKSLAYCLGRTRPAVLSLEERRSEVKRLLHEVQGCLPCAEHARRPTGGPCCRTVVVVAARGGRRPTRLRCHLTITGA